MIEEKQGYLNYSQALQAISDMAVIFDRDGLIAWANPAFCKTFGLPEDDLKAPCSMVEFLGDEAKAVERLKQLRQEPDEQTAYDCQIVTADGPRWHEWRFSSLENAPDCSPGFVGLGRDATHHHWKLDSLTQMESRLRSLLDVTPFAILSLNRDKMIVECNRQIEPMLRYSRDEILGVQVTRLIQKDYLDIVHDALSQTITRRAQVTKACRLIRKDGTICETELITTPMLDEDGRFLWAVCFLEDLSLRPSSQLQRTEAAEAATYQESLHNKDIAFKELLGQLEEQKSIVKRGVQSNLNRLVLPMIHRLEEHLDSENRSRMAIIKNAMLDITAPYISELEVHEANLTPREIQICSLIQNGMDSKQIATTMEVSVHTIHNQRRTIRRKLDIADQETNLCAHLRNLDHGSGRRRT